MTKAITRIELALPVPDMVMTREETLACWEASMRFDPLGTWRYLETLLANRDDMEPLSVMDKKRR